MQDKTLTTSKTYFTIFVTLAKKLIKFCPVLFALLFYQGNKKFLPQSAGKCISEGLISKILIHVTGDI